MSSSPGSSVESETFSELSLEQELIARIRVGDDAAWKQVIATYEARLRAFAFSRLGDSAIADDVVQETFIGFLTSLPNYEDDRSGLEVFLFRIAAYKITDELRRRGRRPTRQGIADFSDRPGSDRKASSLARSREGSQQQRRLLREELGSLIAAWKRAGQWERLKTCELLYVRGWSNSRVAEFLGISAQQVANHKQVVTSRLRRLGAGTSVAERPGLSVEETAES